MVKIFSNGLRRLDRQWPFVGAPLPPNLLTHATSLFDEDESTNSNGSHEY